MQSRRNFGKLLLGALPVSTLLARIDPTVEGVRLGACTYSFREVPRTVSGDAIEPVLEAMTQCNAGICELFSPQVEPQDPMMKELLSSINGKPGEKPPTQQEVMAKYRAMRSGPEAKKARETLRQWRMSTPMDYFATVSQKFKGAGIDIYAYTLNFQPDFTDEELDKCFQQTKAMGVKVIAASTKVSMIPRLKPLAEKHDIIVAVHGHSDTKHPDEFSSPETFKQALDASPQFKVNLDIGHFSAAGFDPVEYIKQNHERITHLHVKDRKKNDGPNEPLGEGDTPIKPVLQLLKSSHYPLPALIEYEYKGTGSPIDEVKKCLAYMTEAVKG